LIKLKKISLILRAENITNKSTILIFSRYYMFSGQSFLDNDGLDFLSVMILLHFFHKVCFIQILRTQCSLETALLNDGMFGALPFQQFLLKINCHIFLFDPETESRHMGFDFQFVLHLFLELLDYGRSWSKLFFVLWGC